MTIDVVQRDGNGVTLKMRALREVSAYDINVHIMDVSLEADAQELLEFIATYVKRGARIEPNETMAYGYWLIKFYLSGNVLDVWEYKADGSQFTRGAQLTLTYWRDQHRACARAGAAFSPPRPDRYIVISDGVMEGDSVQGVRYPSPEHMSGWWITTDRYNGDLSSLRNEHAYHITAVRPDLVRYLALPFGFRFDLSNGDVWFDAGSLVAGE